MTGLPNGFASPQAAQRSLAPSQTSTSAPASSPPAVANPSAADGPATAYSPDSAQHANSQQSMSWMYQSSLTPMPFQPADEVHLTQEELQGIYDYFDPNMDHMTIREQNTAHRLNSHEQDQFTDDSCTANEMSQSINENATFSTLGLQKLHAALADGKVVVIDDVRLQVPPETLVQINADASLDHAAKNSAMLQAALMGAMQAQSPPDARGGVTPEALQVVSQAIGLDIKLATSNFQVGQHVAYGEGDEKHIMEIVSAEDGSFMLEDAAGRQEGPMSEAQLAAYTQLTPNTSIGHDSAVATTGAFAPRRR